MGSTGLGEGDIIGESGEVLLVFEHQNEGFFLLWMLDRLVRDSVDNVFLILFSFTHAQFNIWSIVGRCVGLCNKMHSVKESIWNFNRKKNKNNTLVNQKRLQSQMPCSTYELTLCMKVKSFLGFDIRLWGSLILTGELLELKMACFQPTRGGYGIGKAKFIAHEKFILKFPNFSFDSPRNKVKFQGPKCRPERRDNDRRGRVQVMLIKINRNNWIKSRQC